ncbi:MAG: UDP-N-acetylmuramate-L-alanine ligase [Microgenomates group bacterium GW2011_GWA2_46_16]|nr:MAG: UDP-N-acetylmuramate-L-alanine ligase [Microgenomates group bacterium GW2011_GWA2_46_16]
MFSGPLRTYGLYRGDWRARIISTVKDVLPHFEVFAKGLFIGKFTLPIPGIHNIQNALGAIALADFIDTRMVAMDRALQSYTGIHRRYEKRFVSPGVVVIDDYGHTPPEIASVFGALRQEYGQAYLICVPCLRQFHRTRRYLEEFTTELAKADCCIVPPIVSGLGDDEMSRNSIKAEDVAAKLHKRSCIATALPDAAAISVAIEEAIARAPAGLKVILTVGSGDTDPVIDQILNVTKNILV